MKLRHIIAAAFAVGTAFAAPAQAGVLAASDLAVSRLLIFDRAGSVVTTGINITTDTRTGNATSDFNGVEGTGAGLNNISKTTFGNGTPPTVDVKQRCAGPSCPTAIGENDTTTHLTVPTGNFALGDMIVSGTAIGGGSGASGLTRADTSIMDPTNNGGANSTISNGVVATTNFAATATRDLRFGLNYNAFLHVFLDGLGGDVSGAATATMSWVLTLKDLGLTTDPVASDGPVILSWSPTQLNSGFIVGDEADLTRSSNNIGGLPIFSDFATIISGHRYSLTINQASNTTASLVRAVPEPASVMLIGLGLAGLGASARRRRVR